MAYAKANLSLLFQTMSGSRKFWLYESADAIATVRAAGYISDAATVGGQGMKVRDIVFVLDTNVPTTQICQVLAITAGAADLSDGTAISETNT